MQSIHFHNIVFAMYIKYWSCYGEKSASQKEHEKSTLFLYASASF